MKLKQLTAGKVKKEIDRRNKLFASATKAQKRVLVANKGTFKP